jgi:RNA polymerase sigma-70 factor (ECF subfamily)
MHTIFGTTGTLNRLTLERKDLMERTVETESQVQRQTAAELYRRWYPAVLDLLARRLGNLEEAENLAQEALLKTLDVSKTQALNSFAAYAMRVATNLATDRLRRRRFESDADPDAQRTPLPANPNAAEFRRLRRAVGRLEEDDRRVILLRYDAQLSFAEIGVELGMSKNGVFARHNRALERLRDMFAIRRL